MRDRKQGTGGRQQSGARCIATGAALMLGLAVAMAAPRIVIVGNTSCAPFDAMVAREIGPLRADYPDVQVEAIFPCTFPDPAGVRAWQVRVPHATNFSTVEMHYADRRLDDWFAMGAPVYGGWMFDGAGRCMTNWAHYRYRQQLERPLTRELLDLKISLSNGVPRVSWRQTKLSWRLESAGITNTYRLVLP